MESLSTRRRRPLKPATVYGWQHCLERWILPNLGNKPVSEVGNGALRQFVEILTAAGLAPKTIVNVVTVVKFVVASGVDEERDQIHPRVWNYEFIQLPLLIKEKQSRPTIHEAEIPGLLNSLKGRYAVLVALVAGTGLRIGEALAVRTEDFDSACQVLHIRRSVRHRREQAPKTLNAIRLVDIPEAMAQVLRRYTEGKDGYLFTTRAGGGFHAFRRFRFAVLRKAGVPENLIKQWMGHSQNLMDLTPRSYGSTCLIVGNGAKELVWDLTWANWAINRECQFARHWSRKPILRQVLEMVAGGRFELTTFGL
jgi:integrase